MKKALILFTLFQFSVVCLFAQTGNIGIGNNTPVAKLDVSGDLALREGTAIAVTGSNPTVTVTLNASNPENSFYRITGTPTGTITLSSIANGVDGQIITLVNATTIKLKVTNTNTAGGILTSGGTTTVISASGTLTLQYSAAAVRWFVTNASGATITDWIKATTTDEPAVSADVQYVNGYVGLGGHAGGNADNAYNFTTNAPAAPLVVVAPGSAAVANTPTATGIRLGMPGTTGSKWSTSADFKIGSYGTSGGNAQSQLDIALGNGGTHTPDATVMSILGNGKVGIGTTSPSSQLHIQTSGNTEASVAFTTNSGSTPVQSRIRAIDNNWSADLLFESSVPGSGSGAVTERMRLNNVGNLGIGDNNPNNKLEVNGWMRIGNQNATGVAEEGAIRYNNSFKCVQFYNGWRWRCIGEPDFEQVVMYDGYNHFNNSFAFKTAGYFYDIMPFNVTNVYPGERLVFHVHILVGTGFPSNNWQHAYKIYGASATGIFYENFDIPPFLASNGSGWFSDDFEIFAPPNQTPGGNLQLYFEYNGDFAYAKAYVEKY